MRTRLLALLTAAMLAAMLVGPAHAQAQPAVTTPTTGPAGVTVFRDALAAGWEPFPRSAGVDFMSSIQAYEGTHALSFTATAPYGALILQRPTAFAGSQYPYLRFAARATTAGQRYSVRLYGPGVAPIGNVVLLANYGGDPATTGWTAYSIPLDADNLNVLGLQVAGVEFQDATGRPQPPLYLDALRFEASPSPPPPAAAAPPPVLTGARRVVGYFPIWAPRGGYTARDIDWSIVTHVAHFSVVPLSDGRIQIPDWGPFPDPLLLSTAHANGARVSLVVGGDHAEATQGFAAMSASATTRRTFITNLMSLVTTNGYDGVDLDWEFPVTSADRTNLTALVRELRDALGTARTLSIAAPASDWNGQWIDIAAVVPSLDWVGAMTYPLAAPSWSPNAFHASALYTNGSPFSIEATRTYYLGRGVPAAKLLVGVPFYGERFDGAADILQPLTNRLGGDMTFPEIAALSPRTWVARRDSVAEAPYLVRIDAPGVITYEDPTSVAAKCAYTRRQGLGGVIIWYIGQDRMGASQMLLQAAAGCR